MDWSPTFDWTAFVNRSVAWIEAHHGATNHDVPPDLRNRWILPDKPSPTIRRSVLAIFLAGHVDARTRAALEQVKETREVDLKLTQAEIAERFESWQIKLICAKLAADGRQQTAPMPLFSLNADEEISIQT